MTTVDSHMMGDSLPARVRRQLGARLGDVWRVGDRLPPIRELAAELDISHATAQRAVSELVRNGFLVARARKGTFVSTRFSDAQLRAIFAGHSPEPAAPGRSVGGRRIALFATGSSHLVPAVEAFEAEIAPEGMVVRRETYAAAQRPDQSVGIADADALVMFNPISHWTIDCRPGQVALVITAASPPQSYTSPAHDIVQLDAEQGGMLAARYLREGGCRGVCFVGVGDGGTYLDPLPPYQQTSAERLRGFVRGWGQDIPESNLIYIGGYSPVGGVHAAKKYYAMKDRPRGVFVASDDIAMGFITGLLAMGLELHRDYQLVGFDGQRELANIVPAGVVSVVPPAAAMGTHAAQLLISRLKQPNLPTRTLSFACSLSGQ